MKRKAGGGGRGRKRAPRINLNIKADQVIDYKDTELLFRAIGSQGQIISRRRTTISAQRQRELKQAIKRARHVGLLPFVG